MRCRNFRTSGTTGKPKDFELPDDLLALRVKRLAWTKGPEFLSLKSIVWLNARGSAGHEKIKTWCRSHGVAMHYEYREADGVFGSPVTLSHIAGGPIRFGYVMCGGAPLLPDACRNIRERLLAQGGAMYATYGLSECGTVAIATPDQIEAVNGCVGRVFDDVSTKVVDGVLFVQTPTMAPSEMRDGWICTGDRAEFSADGLLVLKGRSK